MVVDFSIVLLCSLIRSSSPVRFARSAAGLRDRAVSQTTRIRRYPEPQVNLAAAAAYSTHSSMPPPSGARSSGARTPSCRWRRTAGIDWRVNQWQILDAVALEERRIGRPASKRQPCADDGKDQCEVADQPELAGMDRAKRTESADEGAVYATGHRRRTLAGFWGTPEAQRSSPRRGDGRRATAGRRPVIGRFAPPPTRWSVRGRVTRAAVRR